MQIPEMIDWKKVLWRSELQHLIKDCLRSGDMTLQELVTAIQNTKQVKISYTALAAIIKVTEGVIVSTQIFSEASKKWINVYSLAFTFNNTR